MEEIGLRIKDLRKKNKLSLRGLGEQLDISFTHLSRIERGEKTPNLELLNKLAELFNVKMAYFFQEEQQLDFKEWISFGQDMKKYNINPRDLRVLLEVLEKLKI